MGSGDVPCHFLFGCKSVCPNTSARLPIYAEWAFPCSHAAEWASTAPHRSLPMACSEASRQASQVVNEVTFVAVHPTTGQGVVLVVQASIDACTTNTQQGWKCLDLQAYLHVQWLRFQQGWKWLPNARWLCVMAVHLVRSGLASMEAPESTSYATFLFTSYATFSCGNVLLLWGYCGAEGLLWYQRSPYR